MFCLQPPNFVRSYKVLPSRVPIFPRRFTGFQNLSCGSLWEAPALYLSPDIYGKQWARLECNVLELLIFILKITISYKHDLGQHISDINVHIYHLRILVEHRL